MCPIKGFGSCDTRFLSFKNYRKHILAYPYNKLGRGGKLFLENDRKRQIALIHQKKKKNTKRVTFSKENVIYLYDSEPNTMNNIKDVGNEAIHDETAESNPVKDLSRKEKLLSSQESVVSSLINKHVIACSSAKSTHSKPLVSCDATESSNPWLN